ncbi:hypothetical protein Tco_1421673 [Tanacetum coccineum]
MRTMAKLIFMEYMEKAHAELNPVKPNTDNDMNIKLNKEFFMEFRSNAYHRMFDKDVVDHIAKKKFDYGNPHKTATDSSFKPYLKTREMDDIEKEDERSRMKRKLNNCDLEADILNNTLNSCNKNNEQPNKRMYKAEKFEAIKYSLGPNEEYIAIRRCKYNACEKNEDSMYRDRSAWVFLYFAQDLTEKKSTMLVKYLQSEILAH